MYRTMGVIARKESVSWIVFPAVYLVYTLIRGAVVDWYPCPFLNVLNLGYERVFMNIAIMLSIFLVAVMILIAFTRSLKSN